MKLVEEVKYQYDNENRLCKKEIYKEGLLVSTLLFIYGDNVRKTTMSSYSGTIYTLEELDSNGNPISLYISYDKDMNNASLVNRKRYIYDAKNRIYKEFTCIGDSNSDAAVITYYYSGNDLVKSEEITLEGEKVSCIHEYKRIKNIEIENIKEFDDSEAELINTLNSKGKYILTTNFKDKKFIKYKYDKNDNLISEMLYSNNLEIYIQE